MKLSETIKPKPTIDFPTDVSFRLGLWYCVYRIMVIVILLVIYSSSSVGQKLGAYNHSPVFFMLFGYFFWVLIQFLYYVIGDDKNRRSILFNYTIIDIVIFSIITVYIPNNYYVNSIFISMLFIINLITPAPRVFVLIALAIIGSTLPVWASFFGIFGVGIGSDRIIASIGSILIISMIGRIVVGALTQLQAKTVTQDLHLSNLDKVIQMIVNELNTGCMVFNPDNQLVYSNQSCHNLLNTNAKDRKNFIDNHIQLVSQIRDPAIQEFEYENNHTAILVKKKPLLLQPDAGYWTLVFLEDKSEITARVQQIKLQELGQLSASIAHEIRNPLATIVQANDLLLGTPHEDQAHLVNLIGKQASRINYIIQSILMMAKQKEVERDVINLVELLDDLLAGELSHLSRVVKIEVDPEIAVCFDENQLRQVIINLLENANRHNNWQKNTHIMCRALREDKKITLSVIDAGEGVEEPHKLFKPFYSTGEKGTGLGLYLCKMLCETNKAVLQYHKTPQGTCFDLIMDNPAKDTQ